MGAFTLVEVLVATSVLTLTVLMMTSLLNSASVLVLSSSKHLAADDEARFVFDRLQADLARMVKRNDVSFQFLKQANNDQMNFYSETPGYFGTTVAGTDQSNLSLVGYQMNSAHQLCRLGQGYQWTDIAFTPSVPATIDTSNLHVLGDSIFRMEFAFLVRQDDTHLQITNVAPTPGNQSLQNTVAIVVAIAALDSNSQKIVTPSSYPTLISALPDYTGPSQTIDLTTAPGPVASTIDPILSTWRAKINAPNFAALAGIPAAAATQVRIYQRIIYLQ